MTRKQCLHVLQQAIPGSKTFALDRGESLSTAIWSDYESIVLGEVCKLAEQEDMDVAEINNNIVHYSKSTVWTLPLKEDTVFREKTNKQEREEADREEREEAELKQKEEADGKRVKVNVNPKRPMERGDSDVPSLKRPYNTYKFRVLSYMCAVCRSITQTKIKHAHLPHAV